MTFAQNVDYDLTKEKSRPAVCSGGGAWGEIIVNGKKYFRERCARRGICCDAWFKLGAQNSVNNGGYVYHCPPELRKDGQRYAVNYVWERELYIAWNVTSPDAQGQTVFRLLQGALEGAEPNRLLAVEKAEGHRGWGKETVYVFGRDAVDAFLSDIKAQVDRASVDATVTYVQGNSEPFRFTDEQTGLELETDAIRARMEAAILSLSPGTEALQPKEISPNVYRAELENATVLRARVVMPLSGSAAASHALSRSCDAASSAASSGMLSVFSADVARSERKLSLCSARRISSVRQARTRRPFR